MVKTKQTGAIVKGRNTRDYGDLSFGWKGIPDASHLNNSKARANIT